jgi:hypothetical protein
MFMRYLRLSVLAVLLTCSVGSLVGDPAPPERTVVIQLSDWTELQVQLTGLKDDLAAVKVESNGFKTSWTKLTERTNSLERESTVEKFIIGVLSGIVLKGLADTYLPHK